MKYGYARISTKDQRIDLQLDALREVGCSKIFNDIAKGARQDRPELTKLLEIVEEKAEEVKSIDQDTEEAKVTQED